MTRVAKPHFFPSYSMQTLMISKTSNASWNRITIFFVKNTKNGLYANYLKYTKSSKQKGIKNYDGHTLVCVSGGEHTAKNRNACVSKTSLVAFVLMQRSGSFLSPYSHIIRISPVNLKCLIRNTTVSFPSVYLKWKYVIPCDQSCRSCECCSRRVRVLYL